MTERFIGRVAFLVLAALSITVMAAPRDQQTGSTASVVTVPIRASTSTSSSTTSTSTSTSTTSTTVLLVPDSYCGNDVLAVAVDVGWPIDQLAKLDTIMWRESRCNPSAQNLGDPGSVGSVGIAQVNSAAWCDATQYWPNGFMQQQNIGVIDCHSLFDLRTNLAAALIIWQRGGWSPWATA